MQPVITEWVYSNGKPLPAGTTQSILQTQSTFSHNQSFMSSAQPTWASNTVGVRSVPQLRSTNGLSLNTFTLPKTTITTQAQEIHIPSSSRAPSWTRTVIEKEPTVVEMETVIRPRDVIVTPQNQFTETIRLKEENIILQQKIIVEPEGYVVQAQNSPRSGSRVEIEPGNIIIGKDDVELRPQKMVYMREPAPQPAQVVSQAEFTSQPPRTSSSPWQSHKYNWQNPYLLNATASEALIQQEHKYRVKLMAEGLEQRFDMRSRMQSELVQRHGEETSKRAQNQPRHQTLIVFPNSENDDQKFIEVRDTSPLNFKSVMSADRKPQHSPFFNMSSNNSPRQYSYGGSPSPAFLSAR